MRHFYSYYPIDPFVEQKTAVSRKIEEKRRLLVAEGAQHAIGDMEKDLERCFDWLRNPADKWISSDHPTRLWFQKMLFPEGKLPFDGIRFGNTQLPFVYELNRQFAGEKSCLVGRNGTYLEFGMGCWKNW